MNVFDTLAQAARQWPDRAAIIDAAGSLDYRSLWREIESLRAQLARLEVREGQGVGVRARNGRAFVIGALAALGCGATVMPIHHQMKPDELADMLARAPLGFILDDGSSPGQAGAPPRKLELSGGLGLRFTPLDGPPRPLAPGFEDAAFVRFTSGTTGAAKGVLLTHRAVIERITAANKGLGLTCEDRVLWVLPMAYHFYVSILLPAGRGRHRGRCRLSGGEHPGRGVAPQYHLPLRNADARAHADRRRVGADLAARPEARHVRLQSPRSPGRAGFPCAVWRAGGSRLWHH